MVTFAKCDKGGEDMVARGVAVIEGLVTKPVSERIDAEGGLLDEEDAKNACIDESTEPVVPSET